MLFPNSVADVMIASCVWYMAKVSQCNALESRAYERDCQGDLQNHPDGIIIWARSHQPKGFLEAIINALFQAVARKARGCGNFSAIRTIVFLLTSKLDFSKINLHVA